MSLFFPFAFVALSQNEPARVTVQDLEKGMRESRQKLVFGALQIKTEHYSFGVTERNLEEIAERRVWFDEKKTRVSWVGKSKLQQHVDQVVHVCVPYRMAGDSLFYKADPPPIGARIVIKRQDKNDGYNHYLIDPKAIGLYPMPMPSYFNYKLDGLLSRPNVKSIVRATTWDGVSAYEITYEFLEKHLKDAKTKLRIIVVPRMEYAVPEVQLTAVYDGQPYDQTTRIQLKRFGKSQRWYPHKLHFRKTQGGRLLEDDNTEVVAADFDTRPPENAFRLSAMDIPPGTPVIIDFDGKRREWNGREIVEKPGEEK